tara:strand:+ start:429 stop:542 length:114 start_codon:yes stop_codon:yes gene_type:complete
MLYKTLFADDKAFIGILAEVGVVACNGYTGAAKKTVI